MVDLALEMLFLGHTGVNDFNLRLAKLYQKHIVLCPV